MQFASKKPTTNDMTKEKKTPHFSEILDKVFHKNKTRGKYAKICTEKKEILSSLLNEDPNITVEKLSEQIDEPAENIRKWLNYSKKTTSDCKKTRKNKRVLTRPEEDILESAFRQCTKPRPEKYRELANKANINSKQIRKWFKYRRRKLKKLVIEEKAPHLSDDSSKQKTLFQSSEQENSYKSSPEMSTNESNPKNNTSNTPKPNTNSNPKPSQPMLPNWIGENWMRGGLVGGVGGGGGGGGGGGMVGNTANISANMIPNMGGGWMGGGNGGWGWGNNVVLMEYPGQTAPTYYMMPGMNMSVPYYLVMPGSDRMWMRGGMGGNGHKMDGFR